MANGVERDTPQCRPVGLLGQAGTRHDGDSENYLDIRERVDVGMIKHGLLGWY